MTIQRLKFYFHRLKRSSTAEIAHRFKEYCFLNKLKNNPDLYKKDFSFDLSKTTNKHLRFPKLISSINNTEITQLLTGKEYTLSESTEALNRFVDSWKGIFFSEIHPRKIAPDIRAVWEPARLQHLMILLQQLPSEHDKATHKSIQKYIQSSLFQWQTNNPFPYGPHYMSVMECGLRIPVFINALQTLNYLSTVERNNLLLTIFQHTWLIRKRLSLHSSLGNHTICECVGLIMAGGLFKQNKQGQEWLDVGINLLEQECYHQILDDGGPAEQSFAYHRFVLDLYWLAIHFLTENDFCDCTKMRQRITLGEAFLQTIQQDNESLPMIGDSDDGFAVAPGMAPVRDISHHGGKKLIPLTIFNDSGYSLFRDTNGLRVLFDHGPLGMEPLNNHGHADCLSLFMSVKDKDFLIDPGTFQYNGDPALRRYFKSTSAHNTVCIDKQDQAKQLTSFVWDRSFLVSCKQKTDSNKQYTITAAHNGYIQQNIPVSHNRTLSLNSDGNVTIQDNFTGSGLHEYALHFHLHPSVIVERIDNTLHLHRKHVSISLKFDTDTITLLCGKNEPLAGWYSEAYGKKRETTTIQVIKHGSPEKISFTTHITVKVH